MEYCFPLKSYYMSSVSLLLDNNRLRLSVSVSLLLNSYGANSGNRLKVVRNFFIRLSCWKFTYRVGLVVRWIIRRRLWLVRMHWSVDRHVRVRRMSVNRHGDWMGWWRNNLRDDHLLRGRSSILLKQNVIDGDITVNMNKLHQVQRHAMTKYPQMMAIDSDLVVQQLSKNDDFECFVFPGLTSSVALLCPPRSILQMIPDDHFFTWSDARMENDVTASKSWRVEEVNHASELKMTHQSHDSSKIRRWNFTFPCCWFSP